MSRCQFIICRLGKTATVNVKDGPLTVDICSDCATNRGLNDGDDLFDYDEYHKVFAQYDDQGPSA